MSETFRTLHNPPQGRWLSENVARGPEVRFNVGHTRITVSGTPTYQIEEATPYPAFTVTATGGVAPYAFTVWSGALPTGMSLNASTGVVSGTPSLDVDSNQTYVGIVIKATDAHGRFGLMRPFSIFVLATGTVLATQGGDFIVTQSGFYINPNYDPNVQTQSELDLQTQFGDNITVA